MTNIKDMLRKAEAEILDRMAKDSFELKQVRAALAGIDSVQVAGQAATARSKQFKGSMNVNDAVLEAVKNGKRKPADILKFVNTELNMGTTINSVRTRITKLKNAGLIQKIDDGWAIGLPQLPKQKAPDETSEASKVTEEVAPSSDEDANLNLALPDVLRRT